MHLKFWRKNHNKDLTLYELNILRLNKRIMDKMVGNGKNPKGKNNENTKNRQKGRSHGCLS